MLPRIWLGREQKCFLALRIYQLQNRIGCVERLIRKINSGGQAAEQAARHQADGQVRSLGRACFGIDGTGLDGGEGEMAFFVGGDAALAEEIGVEGFLLRVVVMCIFAVGVGLPDFEDGVRHWRAVAVKDLTVDDNSLAEGVGAGNAAEVTWSQSEAEKRADRLPSGGDELGGVRPSGNRG